MLFNLKLQSILVFSLAALITGCLPTKVTYIGSAGFMLESESKKILVDAPFADFVQQFEVPIASQVTQDNIATASAPFNDIDLLLITHSHPGHFDFGIVAEHMKINPDVKLVGTPAVYSILENEISAIDFDLFKDRIIAPVLAEDFETTSIEVDDLTIRISRAPHWSRPGTTDEGYLYNYAFNLDDVEIVYALGLDGYVNTSNVDILISGDLDNNLDPKHLVLTHKYGHATIAELAREMSTTEGVTFMSATLQDVLLIKNDNGSVVAE